MSFLETTRDINISAPINQLGYGVTGLNLVNSLAQLGHTVSLWMIGQPDVPEEYVETIKESVGNARKPNFNAPSIRLWHQHDMSEFVGKGTKVGFPIFELDTFNDLELHHLSNPDEYFVCSQWAKDVLIENLYKHYKWDDIGKRTHVIPLGVDRKIFKESISTREETVFFNCGKWEIRKGHDILVRAFNKAFEPTDNVELWMMCDNPFYSPEESFQWERMYKGSGLGDKIVTIPRQKTQKEVYNIMMQTDCGVFPSRAEGWNLELLEMMSCGKNVIATNYSAHTEFCNSDNCMLVDTDELEDAHDGKWFRGQGKWAKIDEKQIDQLAELMREVHKKKQSDNLKINQEGIETAKKFSWEASAKKIVDTLYRD